MATWFWASPPPPPPQGFVGWVSGYLFSQPEVDASDSTLLWATLAVAAGVAAVAARLALTQQRPQVQSKCKDGRARKPLASATSATRQEEPTALTAERQLTVFFASQKGHSKRFAAKLVGVARERGVEAVAVDLTGFDTDRLVEHTRACFIVATYAGGSSVPGTEPFFHELSEMSRDFRVEKTLLAGLAYGVFGCGNSEYPAKDFNACARKLDRALRNLGAKRLLSRCEGDDIDNALSEQFDAWLQEQFWPCFEKKQYVGGATAQPRDDGRTPAQRRRLERMRKQGELDAAKAEAAAAQRLVEQATDDDAATGAPVPPALTPVVPAFPAPATGDGSAAAGSCGGECKCQKDADGDQISGADGTPAGNECCSTRAVGSDAHDKAHALQHNFEGGFDARGERRRGGGVDGDPALQHERSETPLTHAGDGVVPLPFESEDEMSEHGSDGGYGSDGGEVLDVEDLGSKMGGRLVADGKGGDATNGVGNKRVDKAAAAARYEAERKPMVTPSLAKSLEKQGYQIVGSHSGVKLCRWTKAMLRGRGGCYKHTFYGIVSYQCMEATPSLACANKCVFCWRHHDNPVGTSFRWQIDHPKELVDGFEERHKAMIRQMKGVPGVKPERFAEASKTVRHCALSLVGEPIIYPRVNELLDLLHGRGISSFMVTNAQFPEQMESLKPCTQLYISVDAPTPEELKAVDRPLFPDFWERFLTCVDMLRAKRQRTVFRLTLVNGWNTEQLTKYVELVRRGKPDFIEVKGVTYCGDSKASPLTIKHCPYHAEVRAYCSAMVRELGAESGYELASEHAHSNIVLIASTDFKMGGQWHTWIDYDRFAELANSGEPFGSLDYCAPTPSWAVYDENALDGGFDPAETRFVRKGGGQTVTGGGC